ncbi:hypothetical protein Tco_1448406 [Tanacetum coccineum]
MRKRANQKVGFEKGNAEHTKSIAASAAVTLIYIARFLAYNERRRNKESTQSSCWNRKELNTTLRMTLVTNFSSPQANDNNHASFVPPPSFSDMMLNKLQDDDIMKISSIQEETRTRLGADYHMMITEERSLQSIKVLCNRMPSAEKSDEMILQDTIQVSLAEHKSREEQEARENVATKKRTEDTYKRTTEVEPDKDTPMVDVTNIVTPVNVEDDEEDEISDEVFELRRRVKGKNVEETRISPIPSPTRSPRNLSTLVRYGYLYAHPRKVHPRKSSDQLADNLHDVMLKRYPRWVRFWKGKTLKKEKERLISKAIFSNIIVFYEQQHQIVPSMKADPLQQQEHSNLVALQMKFEKTPYHKLLVDNLLFVQRSDDLMMISSCGGE